MTPDLLMEYANAEDEPTAQEAGAALAAALRRKQDLGTLATLSGGKLAPAGGALLGAAAGDGQALLHAGVARTAMLNRKQAQDMAQMHEQARMAEQAQRQGLQREMAMQGQARQQAALEETIRHNKAAEARRMGAGGGKGGHGVKGALELDENGNLVPHNVQEARLQLKQNALKPRPDWEPIDPTAPTFRNEAQATKFDDASAALGALQNHRKHAAEALAVFRNAKTLPEKDSALAIVNQQMANIASKLRVAEGLNNSDAANTAVDEMLSLSHGSVANLRNLANQGRLDAILDSALQSAGVNLDTMASQYNTRRKTKKAAPTEGGEAPAGGPRKFRMVDGKLTEVK